MKIALLGYGKMGREVEKTAIERNHEIALTIDIENATWHPSEIIGIDAAIEFSTPGSAVDNILKCFEANVPVVVGTTGWLDRFEEIKETCIEKEQALFYASNFSIGVNIFFEINRKLAQLMDTQPGYDVSMEEIHHIHKLDAPSGTAITIAEDIISNVKRKQEWVNAESNEEDKIGITSAREGEVPGTHSINYDSPEDHIQIMHKAKGRKGFALGAVLAAEWIIGKQGVFSMKDLMKL